MVKPHITELQYFPIYRMDPNHLTVRAGSPFYAFGGSTHRVTGGYFHLLFNNNPLDYDVAVLVVCTGFDIPIDSAKHVICL
jgi:hypothetical protein